MGTGDMPEAWANANLVNLVRDMLLLEQNGALYILPGVPADWIGVGEEISVRDENRRAAEFCTPSIQAGFRDPTGCHRPRRRCRMVRFSAGTSRRSMKAKVRVLFLSSVCLVWPALLPAGVDESCVVKCMERSGCWSGGSVTMPGYCNNKPELCNIECSTDSWGAIAYSWKDKISGWSYGKSTGPTP